MKKLSLLIIFVLLTGCTHKPFPAPEKEKKEKHSTYEARKKALLAQDEKQTTLAQAAKATPVKKKTVKKKTTKRKSIKKKPVKKRTKKHVKPKVIKKRIAKKSPTPKPQTVMPDLEEEKTVSLAVQTASELLTNENRHIFFVGKKVKPLKKKISKIFKIKKGQSKHLKTLKELFSQEVQRQSTFITITTLSDLFKEKPLYKTLNNIENLATKKSFFVVFYNYEKNLLELLDTKLLNGLKNVLLFMPLSNKTAIGKEESVYKLTKALQSDSVTFKQMHEVICDNNIKECSSHILGNDYLLY